ncbi:MAG: DUF21 domain-containing protein [Bacteroidales bacterium]|nr:DUF21 domain-containing protein [Bacteroidales bacterium]
MTLLLIFLFIAIGISFLCSILESVLMSTPISFITMKVEDGYKPAERFREYKDKPNRPLAAILSLNTIANTIGAAGVGRQATIIFGSEWFGLISAITTLLILIFAEIIPKTIGTTYYKKLMGLTAAMLKGMIFVMYPVVILIEFISSFIEKDDQESTVSREEVSAIANVGEEEGVLEEDENKVIQNLIGLDEIKAYDAMTPRVVAAIASQEMSLRNYYKDNSFLHHSRIPVYSDDPDFIVGYILRSDALKLLADDKFDMRLKDIKREIAYFNEETSLGEIWERFMEDKDQIAAIIDEYGAFQGILTLEDIIETIFGQEIVDEQDEFSDMQQYARERWQKRKPKSLQEPVKGEKSE